MSSNTTNQDEIQQRRQRAVQRLREISETLDRTEIPMRKLETLLTAYVDCAVSRDSNRLRYLMVDLKIQSMEIRDVLKTYQEKILDRNTSKIVNFLDLVKRALSSEEEEDLGAVAPVSKAYNALQNNLLTSLRILRDLELQADPFYTVQGSPSVHSIVLLGDLVTHSTAMRRAAEILSQEADSALSAANPIAR